MNDNILRADGMNALIDRLGAVDAEKFIYLVKKDKLDYTKWHNHLYKGMSALEINEMAAKRYKEKYPDEFN
jgi:hypothetical protein